MSHVHKKRCTERIRLLKGLHRPLMNSSHWICTVMVQRYYSRYRKKGLAYFWVKQKLVEPRYVVR